MIKKNRRTKIWLISMIDVRHKNIRKSSLPRTGREMDAIGGTTGVAAPAFVGGGSSGPRYWDLINTDAEGNALPEGKEYINTTYSAHTDGSFVAKGDVVACASDSDIKDIPFPVAGYDMAGIVRIKPGSGLIVREGILEVDPSFAGGLDEEQLELYLTNNKYVTEEKLKTGGYITLTSPLAGYKLADKYAPVTTTDTILTAFGKLERNFSNYVDLTTDQLIKGKKTFEETIFSKKDIIASAIDTSVEDVSFPIASATRLGCVKIGANLSITTDGVLSALAGGGIAFTPGTALQLTSNDVLNVVFGTTGTTACAGNDSRLSNARPNPYALTFTGFSTGTYTGASSLTIAIPTNNSQLSNGAGYIKGINKSMILSALTGSGSSSKYLAGDGTFYTISYGEIAGTPTLNYLPLTGGTLTGNLAIRNSGPILYFYNSADTGLYWSIRYPGTSDLAFYRQGSKTAWLTPAGDFVTAGDIVASATSSSISDIMAVASSSTYGLVKYDNSTIRMNSSGQLYCTISGGGSGGGNVEWSGIQDYTINLMLNGSSSQTYTLLRSAAAAMGSASSGYRSISIKGTTDSFATSSHTHTWSSITSKPSWIGSSKPSYSWSEITGKPSVLSSISYSTSGSGNVVTNVTASGSTVYVTKGSISGGSSFNGGRITGNLEIYKSGANLTLNNGSYSWTFLHSGDTMYLQKNGSYLLYVKGGNWTINSDERIKNILAPVGGILDKLKGLSVFNYTFKNRKSSMMIGVSAQEVRRVFPEVVSVGGYEDMIKDYALGVDYATLGAVVAIGGLKELDQKYSCLESRMKSLDHWKTTKDRQIDFLMKENALLKARVSELEGRAA